MAIGFLSCLCALLAGAQTPASLPDLASADWSVKQAKVLNAESNDAVWKFVNYLWGNDDLGPGNGKLCEFQFADLRHSGELSLVVSYDNGGTADCNMVDALDKTPEGIKDYAFNDAWHFYFDSIEDINGDGNHELILDALFVPAMMDHCGATWPVIYSSTGSGYSDVSSHYKDYYRRLLNSPSSTDQNGIYCEKAIDDKIKRFLGSPNAGLDDAIKWSNSDAPEEREFAAWVFRDIGTPEALEHLRALNKNRNRNFAGRAKNAQLNIQQYPPYPSVTGELLTPDYASPFAK